MNHKFQLHSKTIVVSGASSGIGRSCAVEFSKAGATLILLGRDEDRLNETMSDLDGSGHAAFSFDLREVKEIKNKVKEIVEQFPVIDGIVNSAGVSKTLPIRVSSQKHMQEVFEVNVYGAFELTRHLLKLSSHKGMSVVFIASVMGSVGEKGKTIYSMTKGAILSGCRSMALELAASKVRVNCISPSVIDSPMTENAIYRRSEEAFQEIQDKHPLGLGKPEDVANAAQFLLSDASQYITGIDLKVDGGYTAK